MKKRPVEQPMVIADAATDQNDGRWSDGSHNTFSESRSIGFPSNSVKSHFTQVAQENAASIWG